MGSVPRGLFRVLTGDEGSDIRPVRLTGLPAEVSAFETKAGVFHFLGIFASLSAVALAKAGGSLCGVLGSKTAISLQHGSPRTFSVNGVV